MARRKRVRSDMGKYATVPLWLVEKGVSGNAIKLFTIIAAAYSDFETDEAEGIPRKELAEWIGKSLDTVDRAKQELIAAGALVVEQRFHKGSRLEDDYFLRYANPDAAKPQIVVDTDPEGGRKSAATQPQGCGDGGRNGAAPLKDSELNQKEVSKETSCVDTPGEVPGEAEGDRLCELLGQLLRADGEKANIVEGLVRSPRWRNAARAMFAEDGRDLEEAMTLLRWSQHDPEWRAKITTIAGFRKLYRSVRLAAERDTRNGRKFGGGDSTNRVVPPGTVLADQATVDAVREVFRSDVSEDVDGIWIEQLWFGFAEIDGKRTLVAGGCDRAVSWIELRYRRVLADCATRALGVDTPVAIVAADAPDPPPPTEDLANVA